MARADVLAGILKKGLYVDTNIWSDLAKGALPNRRLRGWIEEEGGYLMISRFQLAELVARADLVKGLVRCFGQLQTAITERAHDELAGEPWVWNSGYEVFHFIDVSTPGLREVVTDEMLRGPITAVPSQLRRDALQMRDWIERSVDQVPPPPRNPWRRFPDLLDRYIQARCKAENRPSPPEWRGDPRRYRGIRLQFAMLFARFYVAGATWKESDYGDALHCLDIAYVDAVVTENRLASELQAARGHLPGIVPTEIYTMKWLRSG